MNQDRRLAPHNAVEDVVLDQLWRHSQFGEPPRGNSDVKRELLNRIGVMNDYIDALISQEIDLARSVFKRT